MASVFVSYGDIPKNLCLTSDHFAQVTAIANYTVRVAQTSLSATQRQEALKFLGERYCISAQYLSLKRVQIMYEMPITCDNNTDSRFCKFLGDIGQPLHVEVNLARVSQERVVHIIGRL